MTGYEWLDSKASNVYSQQGEDGVIDAIFNVIQPANRWCFECGASDGLFFSNTRRLIRDGWDAVLVESDPAAYRRLTQTCKEFGPSVRTFNEQISSIDPYLFAAGAPSDIDLVVIDVDGQDYYLLNSMLRFRPRVVLIEFDHNADPEFIPEFGGPGQAGSVAIMKLAAGKFYHAVWQNWCNLVLVMDPLHRLLSYD